MRAYASKSRYHGIYIALAFSLFVFVCFFSDTIVACLRSSYRTIKLSKGIEYRKSQYETIVQKRLESDFRRIGSLYPPKKLILIGLKKERILEVWVADTDNTPYKLLRKYPILGASGHLGPKLREGDGQVPEGFYRVDGLNPNSSYHLALHINYPNALDRAEAQREGRELLGGEIMIHGGVASAGCLAMGDEAIEDLFILALTTGLENIDVILSPVDFRITALPPDMPLQKEWVLQLYDSVKYKLPVTQANLTSQSDSVRQKIKR